MAKTKETTEQEKTLQDAISLILQADLSSLSLDAVEELRNKAADALQDAACGRLGEHDVVLEYSVRLRTARGEVSSNYGVTRMNKVLSPRLLGDAPRRFESEFMQQVYEPVYADAIDLMDSASRNPRSLGSIKQSIGNYDKDPLPGLPEVLQRA